MNYKYGHFNNTGDEFIITDPRTPRAFDNFLWNEALFSNVQQTGVGYCDYQVDGKEGVQLFTGIGRICDFDVFGRDHLMNRLVYLRDNETGKFWTVNWEPVCREYEEYSCTHGLGYTVIRNRTEGIEAEFRIFVPAGNDPVELWTIRLHNVSGRPRTLSLYTYNQFQFKYKWGFDSYGDMIYRAVDFKREQNTLIAVKHPFLKPHQYLTGFMAVNVPVSGFDGSRDAFLGLYNTLAAPQAVTSGRCSNTPGSAEATVGALQFDCQLAADGTQEISLIIGAAEGEAAISVLRERYLGKMDEYFAALRRDKVALQQLNQVSTPDPHFDRIVNNWVKQAALYGSTWCRWGWNGYRDIVQHGLGVAAIKPERTKEILLQALHYQYSSGLALRGWNPVDEKPYSDSALWLVFTLVAYLKETGDFSLLALSVPFYDGGSDTVLGHIERALNFLEANKGEHQLCLIKFGDWNDSLTGVGKQGRGESVWLSQAYAEAARLMADLMKHLKETAKEQDYLARRERLLEAINQHAWDGDWYLRCFDDAGKALGSKDNEFARIFMETQSWALIAGVANDTRARQLLDSCDKILSTPVGYLLLSPSFKRVDDNIGRISSMEPGIGENGTVYSHLNIWLILGLLRYGMADKAYEVFRRITPGYVDGDMALKQNCLPYMYANCYYGPEHRNNKFQMEFSWITGSVAWFNTVLQQEMLGVRADYDGLVIDPSLPSSWKTSSMERMYRGARYHITIRNPHGLQRGRVSVLLNGEPIVGNRLPLLPAKSEAKVEVVMEVDGR